MIRLWRWLMRRAPDVEWFPITSTCVCGHDWMDHYPTRGDQEYDACHHFEVRGRAAETCWCQRYLAVRTRKEGTNS